MTGFVGPYKREYLEDSLNRDALEARNAVIERTARAALLDFDDEYPSFDDDQWFETRTRSEALAHSALQSQDVSDILGFKATKTIVGQGKSGSKTGKGQRPASTKKSKSRAVSRAVSAKGSSRRKKGVQSPPESDHEVSDTLPANDLRRYVGPLHHRRITTPRNSSGSTSPRDASQNTSSMGGQRPRTAAGTVTFAPTVDVNDASEQRRMNASLPARGASAMSLGRPPHRGASQYHDTELAMEAFDNLTQTENSARARDKGYHRINQRQTAYDPFEAALDETSPKPNNKRAQTATGTRPGVDAPFPRNAPSKHPSTDLPLERPVTSQTGAMNARTKVPLSERGPRAVRPNTASAAKSSSAENTALPRRPVTSRRHRANGARRGAGNMSERATKHVSPARLLALHVDGQLSFSGELDESVYIVGDGDRGVYKDEASLLSEVQTRTVFTLLLSKIRNRLQTPVFQPPPARPGAMFGSRRVQQESQRLNKASLMYRNHVASLTDSDYIEKLQRVDKFLLAAVNHLGLSRQFRVPPATNDHVSTRVARKLNHFIQCYKHETAMIARSAEDDGDYPSDRVFHSLVDNASESELEGLLKSCEHYTAGMALFFDLRPAAPEFGHGMLDDGAMNMATTAPVVVGHGRSSNGSVMSATRPPSKPQPSKPTSPPKARRSKVTPRLRRAATARRNNERESGRLSARGGGGGGGHPVARSRSSLARGGGGLASPNSPRHFPAVSSATGSQQDVSERRQGQHQYRHQHYSRSQPEYTFDSSAIHGTEVEELDHFHDRLSSARSLVERAGLVGDGVEMDAQGGAVNTDAPRPAARITSASKITVQSLTPQQPPQSAAGTVSQPALPSQDVCKAKPPPAPRPAVAVISDTSISLDFALLGVAPPLDDPIDDVSGWALSPQSSPRAARDKPHATSAPFISVSVQ